MKFVLASHNKGKLREMAAILGELGIEVEALPEGAPEPEELLFGCGLRNKV